MPPATKPSRCQRRAKAKQYERAQASIRSNEGLAMVYTQLTNLHGRSTSPTVTVHRLFKVQGQLEKVKAMEDGNKNNHDGFLSLPEVTASFPNVTELHDGYNILVDADTNQVFGQVYYHSLANLDAAKQKEVLDVMSTVDKVTRTTQNNATSNGAAHAHGNKARTHGTMALYGWKQSFEKGGRINRYVPQRNNQAKAQMAQLDDGEMFRVAQYYESAFAAMNQCASSANHAYAKQENIPSFHVLDEADFSKETLGWNSFSTTSNGFCNVVHRDQDVSPFNFGLFFAGTVKDKVFAQELGGVSKQLHGGEFWWPEYGVVVGHAAAGCWTEVMWRGDKDYHGTLSCWLEPGSSFEDVNRWGSSCQMTKKFQDRVRKGRRS